MAAKEISRRRIIALASAGVAAGAIAGPMLSRPTKVFAADPFAGYVMGYFTESPDRLANNYGLHIATSSNGLNWAPLNQNGPVVTPTAGTQGLRDPFIFRKQDGTFVVLATDLAGLNFSENNQYIHVWESLDLTAFTNYRRVKLHDLPTHSWAPEAFWDPARNQYGITYSAFNGSQDVLLVNYTNDFVNVSAPQTFFDPGVPIIDGTFAVNNGTYYLYYKDDNKLFGARSTSLTPGSFNRSTYTSGYAGPGLTEAPIIVPSLDGANWYLWGDIYTPVNGLFNVWTQTDLDANSWTPVSKRAYTQPINSKHATVQRITAAEKSRLETRWGLPRWNRLKSYNFPDRFIRHRDFIGRIDAYPFDPFTDSQFVLTAGLAGQGTLSFQSATDPNLYLRHSGFEIKLSRNDGSTGFAQDATFTRTAGLADSSWTTFRSFNFPDRALRHAGFVLRIDPVNTQSSASDKQDATFAITY